MAAERHTNTRPSAPAFIDLTSVPEVAAMHESVAFGLVLKKKYIYIYTEIKSSKDMHVLDEMSQLVASLPAHCLIENLCHFS